MSTPGVCPACLKPYRECLCAFFCALCGCATNHTTTQHREAERDEP